MATSVLCDSCGKAIDVYLRTTLQVPANAATGEVGGLLDLCEACAANLHKDPKVKKAKENYKARQEGI